MKKMIFGLITLSAFFIPVGVSEGQVMPVCTVIYEEKAGAEADINSVSINKELEDYVVGVVAGEMPYNFPHEALKAQAVAARTYAIRQLNEKPDLSYSAIDQAYITLDEMKKRWGSNFDANYDKIRSDVYATAGEILEYNNEPILAVFCSTTNGRTEECENVWTQDLPYLSSVKSEGDELSPYYSDSKTYSGTGFKNIFGSTEIGTVSKTAAGYVSSVNIGGKVYSGARIRQLLGLKSTSFDIVKEGDNITIYTKGYGHGVGMSQYGACYMANNGKGYREILSHYYKDTIIKNL